MRPQIRHVAIGLAMCIGPLAMQAQPALALQQKLQATLQDDKANLQKADTGKPVARDVTADKITAVKSNRAVKSNMKRRSLNAVAHGPRRLTPPRRKTVSRTIVRERVALVRPTVAYRAGLRAPPPVYPAPMVAVAAPAIKPDKYMVVNNRVVLFDPSTSEVVAELPN